VAVSLLIMIVAAAGLLSGYSMGASESAGRTSALQSEITSLDAEVSSLSAQLAALQSSADANGTVYLSGSLNALYASVKDSIVTVMGVVKESMGYGYYSYSEVLGSGFVVNLTGECLVVTNCHVIDGMINGSVTFTSGEAYPFEVLGADEFSDLAILAVVGAPEGTLVPLEVASSSTVRVGDPVVAIGNPYGLQSTLTSGIVSQLNRAIQTETSGSRLLSGVIQITAPINPGNSGGPLLDAEGRVIGITSAIVSDSQNVGFAIPSDTLLKEIRDLAEHGSYSHPYIGITGAAVDYLIADAAGLDTTYGVLVQTVTAGSPADAAGLQGGTYTVTVAGTRYYAGGDLIVEVDGQRVRSMDDLTSYIELNAYPGTTVSLTVMRGGGTIEVPVTLGAYG
jgi:S1-C subfamily serine protease